MTEIDELEGLQLDIAIVSAIKNELCGDSILYHEYDGVSRPYLVKTHKQFKPSRCIEQAWELDGEGWLWESREYIDDVEVGGDLYPRMLEIGVYTGRRTFYATVNLKRFTSMSKLQAYATARCRAFLKVMAARDV